MERANKKECREDDSQKPLKSLNQVACFAVGCNFSGNSMHDTYSLTKRRKGRKSERIPFLVRMEFARNGTYDREKNVAKGMRNSEVMEKECE